MECVQRSNFSGKKGASQVPTRINLARYIFLKLLGGLCTLLRLPGLYLPLSLSYLYGSAARLTGSALQHVVNLVVSDSAGRHLRHAALSVA